MRFRVQRYRRRVTSLESSYFDLTDQFQEGYVSLRLKEFVTYYAGRISYNRLSAPLLWVLRISFSAHVLRTIYLQNPIIDCLKYSISLGWVRRKRTEIVRHCSY